MTEISEERQKRNFKKLNIRFSIRFNFLLFPFDVAELVEQLAKAGYKPTMPPPPRIRGKGIRIGATGKIARKEDVEIDIDDQRGIIGAASSFPALAIESLNEVLQLIKANIDIDLDEMEAFYELIGHFDVETNENPLEKIEQISGRSEFVKQFNEILNEDVSDYTLRLVPRGRAPIQTEWFDITIEPSVIKPSSTYAVAVIYRSEDKSKVEKFTRGLTQNMESLLDIIET